MQLKEKAVVATLATVVLYGILAAYWAINLDSGKRGFGWCPRSWGDAVRKYHAACKQYRDECALIAKRSEKEDEYEAEKGRMPSFDAEKATDTTWLSYVDSIARSNNVHFSTSGAGKEVVSGDVHELPIDVKNFSAGLESIVKFLYDVENAEKGMFNVRSISLKPLNRNKVYTGYLSGSFSISCAYTRE